MHTGIAQVLECLYAVIAQAVECCILHVIAQVVEHYILHGIAQVVEHCILHGIARVVELQTIYSVCMCHQNSVSNPPEHSLYQNKTGFCDSKSL